MPDNDDHVEPDDVDPAFYMNGGVSLSEDERRALGKLDGKRVLVLGAGNGEDALSLVNLGGQVTVIDEVEAMVQARALSQAAHQPVNFVESSPTEIPDNLRTGGFDVVYSGFGGLDWVADLDEWMIGIRAAIEMGGLLIIYDEHPFAFTVGSHDGRLVVGSSYFGSADSEDADEIDSADWTIGDIVTAVGSHGFRIQSLAEFPESERFATILDDIEDVPAEYVACIPGVFLLTAIRQDAP